jgi:FKBP-type peptidyl-prolyl cis-trans isomerase FkpA
MKNTLFALAIILFVSCSKDDEAIDYSAQNDQEITAYIATNNLNAQKSNSGLYYVIDEAGTGLQPTLTDRVKVSYKGYFTDGTVFDESTEAGLSLYLQNVISGWAEGITYFKEGGSGKLLIPAHLAYGSNNYNGIPGGSVLIFDIELIYVNFIAENNEDIQAYLTENTLEAQQTDSGLYYIIDEPGTGAQATITDNVTVTYKGYYLNGTVFDESTQNVNFNLSNIIKGFAEGITFFKEGGSGTLLIPAHLAYGNYDYSSIPGGSVLIFDINLITVN